MPQPRRSDDSSDVIVNQRVTRDERERIRLAAAANFQRPSEFMRDAILNAASETLEDEPQREA